MAWASTVLCVGRKVPRVCAGDTGLQVMAQTPAGQSVGQRLGVSEWLPKPQPLFPTRRAVTAHQGSAVSTTAQFSVPTNPL